MKVTTSNESINAAQMPIYIIALLSANCGKQPWAHINSSRYTSINYKVYKPN